MNDAANDLFKIAEMAREHGTPYVVKTIIDGSQEEHLVKRRKAVLFVGGLLGHRMGADALVQKGNVVIGHCHNCQMQVKLGLDRGIEGRFVEFECPAGRRS